MRRLALIALLLVGVVGCGGGSDGGGSPTAPSPPTPTTYTLSGQVTDSSNGQPVSGATVRIMDGPNAGKSASTNGDGRYTLSALTQSGFTANASRQYYITQGQGVDLTADRTLNFRLEPVPLFTRAGTGASVFDMPTSVSRVRITGTYAGRCENFIVYIGGRLEVNVILGTCSVADARNYDGVVLTTGGIVEVKSSIGINWTFTEVR